MSRFCLAHVGTSVLRTTTSRTCVLVSKSHCETTVNRLWPAFIVKFSYRNLPFSEAEKKHKRRRRETKCACLTILLFDYSDAARPGMTWCDLVSPEHFSLKKARRRRRRKRRSGSRGIFELKGNAEYATIFGIWRIFIWKIHWKFLLAFANLILIH